MSDRIHRAVSADGTEIVARVEGKGPPVVFVPGFACDGEDLALAASHLADDFTCYLMSTRGKGMSATPENLEGARQVQDVLAVAHSIGEPVGLVGHSLGGRLALTAAAYSDQVAAVVAFEPPLPDVLDEEGAAGLQGTIQRMAERLGEGDLTGASTTFFESITDASELDGLREAGFLEKSGRYVPGELKAIQQGGNAPPFEETLRQVEAPILVLAGSESVSWFQKGVGYVVEHGRDVRKRVLEGRGHFPVFFAPDEVAEEVRPFMREALATH